MADETAQDAPEKSKKRVRDVSKTLENANTELRRATASYNKQFNNYDKNIKSLQKNLIANAFNILKLSNVGQLDAMARHGADIASNYAAEHEKELSHKIESKLNAHFKTHRLGIFKKSGGILDRALTRHENTKQFIKDSRMVGSDIDSTGKKMSDSQLKKKYQESIKLQKQVYKSQQAYDRVVSRLGDDLSKLSPEFKQLNSAVVKLKETDFRFVTSDELAMAKNATPHESLLEKEKNRVDTATSKIEKLTGAGIATVNPTVNPTLDKLKKPTASDSVGKNDVKKESVVDAINDSSKARDLLLSGILDSLEHVHGEKKSDAKKSDTKSKLFGFGIAGAVGDVLKNSMGGLLNFAKGALLGNGTGVAGVLGKAAGTAAAAYAMYDVYKNMHKDTTDANGKRMGFFQHKKGSSILRSRAGFYAESGLAGAKIGATIGSIIPGVGTAAGAGVGALIGVGTAFFIDYKKEIMAALNNFKAKLNSFIKIAFDSVKTFFANPVGALESIGKVIAIKFKGVIDYIANAITGIPAAIMSGVLSIGNSFTGIAKSVWTRVESAFESKSPTSGATSAHAVHAVTPTKVQPTQSRQQHIVVHAPTTQSNVTSNHVTNAPTHILGHIGTKDSGNITDVQKMRDWFYSI
jgi:hypothetical protein